MALRTTDTILSTRGGNPRLVVDRLNGPSSDDYAFAERLAYWSTLAGVDVPLALIQWLHETGNAESIRWTRDLNSSGIGIVSDTTSQPFVIPDVDHSARLHVQCLYSLATRKVHPGVPLWPEADSWMARAWIPKVQSRAMPDVRTVHDLGLRYVENGRPRATWSYEDGQVPEDTYGKKLENRGREFYPEAPEQSAGPEPLPVPGDQDPQFGNVIHPPFLDRQIPDSQTRRWDNLGQRDPCGVCQHSMLGSLWGTDGYFRGNTALTDYGVGGSQDGSSDGLIIRWNDPLGRASTVRMHRDSRGLWQYGSGDPFTISANRAPWANGGSDGLEGDGPAYVRKKGVAGINRDLVSIERSDGGQIALPISPKQMESLVALSAYWFDYARVPWDSFPLNPEFDIITYMLHKEFATKDCPFPAVYNRVGEIQNLIRARLKLGQTLQGSPTDPVPPPNPTDPDTSWPHKWTTKALTQRFGRIERQNPDGSITAGGFDKTGVISNAWVARANELGITKVDDIPPPLAWHRIADTEGLEADMVIFDGRGSDNWALFRPAPGIAWRWFEVGSEEAANG